jgi:glycosyltransferase involved in cell wall biosynthesis
VKEIELALVKRYKIDVICFEFNNWSKEYNDELLSKLSEVNFILLSADRKPLLNWVSLTFKERLFRFLLRFTNLPVKAISQAVSRRSDMLLAALKNIKKSDLVIGHNPGSMYATWVAGKKYNCKTGFDVEDFHPGEGSNRINNSIVLKLMMKLLPEFNYNSFSSSFIMSACSKNIKFQNHQQLFVTRNYFRKSDFNFDQQKSTQYSKKIQLVWFSQNINYGRGLEIVLPIIEKYVDVVQLHLIGQINDLFFKKELSQKKSVVIHNPLRQVELHSDLKLYDIGLAIEPGKDLNNNLAISNKLLAFFQSGLFIIATKTDAQFSFLNENLDHGFLVEKSMNDFEDALNYCIDNIEDIRRNRGNRFSMAQYAHWERENIQLNNTWSSLLG